MPAQRLGLGKLHKPTIEEVQPSCPHPLALGCGHRSTRTSRRQCVGGPAANHAAALWCMRLDIREKRHHRLPLRRSAASRDLPNSNFWEDLASGLYSKLLFLLVGAAGFEPTTCSTQNCRATRLRYTPIFGRPRRYTLKQAPARLRCATNRLEHAIRTADKILTGHGNKAALPRLVGPIWR